MEFRQIALLILLCYQAFSQLPQLMNSPCALLGPVISDITCNWTPSPLSFQSSAVLHVTGTALLSVGSVTAQVSLTLAEHTYVFNTNPVLESLEAGSAVNYQIPIPILSGMDMTPGLYQYTVMLGDGLLCYQQTQGSVEVGVNLPFQVNAVNWTPSVPASGQSVTLTLNGVNTESTPLTFATCQATILNGTPQVLPDTPCVANAIQPGAAFTTAAKITLPVLSPGNYTVSLHIFAAEDLGLIEIPLEIGTSALAYFSHNSTSEYVASIINISTKDIAITNVTQRIVSANQPADIINMETWNSVILWGTQVELNTEWCSSMAVGSYEALLDFYGTEGQSIGRIWTFCFSQHKYFGTVTEMTVNPPAASFSDILFISIEGNLETGFSLECFALNYTSGQELEVDMQETDSFSYAIITAPLFTTPLSAGDYLISCTFGDYNDVQLFAPVTLSGTNPSIWALDVEYSDANLLVPGGYTSVNMSLTSDVPDLARCSVTFSQYPETMLWDYFSCYMLQDQGNFTLIIPALDLPQGNLLKPGYFAIVLGLYDSTKTLQAEVSQVFPYFYTETVTTTSLTIFPTFPVPGDTVQVFLTGETLNIAPQFIYEIAFLNDSGIFIVPHSPLLMSTLANGNFTLGFDVGPLPQLVAGDYTLEACMLKVVDGWICWQIYTSIISAPRLIVNGFQWDADKLYSGRNYSFSMDVDCNSHGLFDQSNCLVTIANNSGGAVQWTANVPCAFNASECSPSMTINAGSVQLPDTLTPLQNYSLEVTLLSKLNCTNGMWQGLVEVASACGLLFAVWQLG